MRPWRESRFTNPKQEDLFHVSQVETMRALAEAIATAMRAEGGATPSASKDAGRVTNANARLDDMSRCTARRFAAVFVT
jgi:hypothetical protein